MNADRFVVQILFAYGIVFFHFALMLILRRSKEPLHRLLSALLWDAGAMCLGGSWCVSGGLDGLAPNLAVFLSMLALAPIGSAFVLECLGIRWQFRRGYRGIVVATAVVLVSSGTLILRAAPWKFVFMPVYGLLSAMLFFIAVRVWFALRPIRKMPRGLFVFYCIVCSDAFLVGFMCAFQYFSFYPGLYVLWVLQLICTVGVTFLLLQYPEAFQVIGEDVKKIRYEHSRLDGESAKRYLGLLERRLREDELFRNPDLSLTGLAESVGMKSHELSELINLYAGQNFAGLINSWRVEYAKRALLARPEASVIEVAFECGFNSKSVFNEAFRKTTGKTPTAFRKAAASPGPQ
jgi:AraC-like DNA-binding protein